jgi:M6 family metalloprotease-like protein/uncharacterized repeat protein (TIGR01451 family)
MKTTSESSNKQAGRSWLSRMAGLGCLALLLGASLAQGAPFDKTIEFTQPDGTRLQLHGKGDEFFARFETLSGYTVVFDQTLRAYCYATNATDGGLASTGQQVQSANPATLGLKPGIRMSADARRAVVARQFAALQGQRRLDRWNAKKAEQRAYASALATNGPLPSPPTQTTTGTKVGLTLLVDFDDDVATVAQGDIVDFCNGDNYTGYGNNGSVRKYYYDVSGGKLNYSNVVTIYIRAPKAKTVYNDLTRDCGLNANDLIKDALTVMKALPNFATDIQPLLQQLTVDSANTAVAFNVFYAGGNGNRWMYGLWPHQWYLSAGVGAQELWSGGIKVDVYEVSNIGTELTIGTFCHENGHMLCGYPDEYDYEYDSIGGSGDFSLMNAGASGAFEKNPSQIDAYLKRASGWTTTTELTATSGLMATLTASAGSDFNHIYRFQKPGVSTEYYLAEIRLAQGHDALLPSSGVAIWHVDELGDRDNQSLTYNTSHANYELTLVQADNRWDFEKNANYGDAYDLYYAGNTEAAAVNGNLFNDNTSPSAAWWDGSDSGIYFSKFSAVGDTMTFLVGSGTSGPALSLVTNEISGGNGNGIIEANECNNLTITLTNYGLTSVGSIQATLTTTTPGVVVAQPAASWNDLEAGGTSKNTVDFKVSTVADYLCGKPIQFFLQLKTAQGNTTLRFSRATGVVGVPIRYDNSTNMVVAISNRVSSPVVVSNFTTALRKVAVSLYFTSTQYEYGLRLQLISPDGATNVLTRSATAAFIGRDFGTSCSPDSARTTFDSDAAEPIASGTSPFAGTYQPEDSLAVFNYRGGSRVNGAWRLEAIDTYGYASGVLNCWSLYLTPTLCTDGGGECPGSDLAVGLTVSPNPVVIGNPLTYTISLTNNGPSTAKSVVVNQILPDGAIFNTATASQGGYSVSGNLVTYALGQVAPGMVVTITCAVMPTVVGTVASTAYASSGETDPDDSNNSASASATVTPESADMAVGVLAYPVAATVGTPVTYTVSVTNNGPMVPAGVVVTNFLPAAGVLQSITTSQGSISYAPGQAILSLGSLASGARATALLTIIPQAEGSLVVTSTVASTLADPIPANNKASAAAVIAPAVDLVLSAADSVDPVVTGNSFSYVLAVSNAGPSSANQVVLNLSVDARISAISSVTSTMGLAVVSNNLVTVTVPALAAKAVFTNIVTVVTPLTGSNLVLTSTANVVGAEADPNSANNSASVTTTVAPPFVQLGLVATVLTAENLAANGAIDNGERVTVDFYLENLGNIPTTNLMATLLASGGVAPLAPNAPQTYGALSPSPIMNVVHRPFTFTASGVDGGVITATLQLTDGASFSTNVDVSFTLSKTVVCLGGGAVIIDDLTTASPYPSTLLVSGLNGVIGRVTATVSNLTHGSVSDVDMVLVSPNGARVALISGAGGQYNVNGVNLTFDDLATAEQPTDYGIESGSYRPANYYLGASSLPSPAPVGAYDSAMSAFASANPNGVWSLYVDDHAFGDEGSLSGWSLSLTTITPVNMTADLTVAARAVPAVVTVGGIVTNTFSVTNLGPDVAAGVFLTNVLPGSVSLVSSNATQGVIACIGSTVVANLGAMSNGAVAQVTLVLSPSMAATGWLTNTAAALAVSGETDLNPANNSASVAMLVNLPSADLSLQAEPVTNGVTLGSNVVFRLAVTNRGPDVVLGAVVSNQMPAGITLVSATTSVGSPSSLGQTVYFNLGNLGSNAGAALTIVGRTTLLGALTNVAVVRSSSADAVAANNTASAVVTVVSPAPAISVAKAAITSESGPANGSLDPNEQVTVAFSLTNSGSAPTSPAFKATLLATGGVTAPSSAQTYGSVIPGGSVVARSFSFTAAGANGGVVTATLQLADGATNLGTATFVFSLSSSGTFSNVAIITIPEHGAAALYPSTITVTNLPGVVSKATATLNGFTHSFANDVSVLLVSPSGSSVLLLSHVGSGNSVTNLTLAFDDAATNVLPHNTTITNGTYYPSQYDSVVMPSPAPSSSYGSSLSSVAWGTANGDWKLYVYDGSKGDAGYILNGWTLTLTAVGEVESVSDLAATLTSSTATVIAGQPVTNFVSVVNNGPAGATGVVVTNTLPAGGTYLATIPVGVFSGSSGGKVVLSLGSLAVGSSTNVAIVSSLAQVGAATSAITVAADQEDENSANNSASSVVTVYSGSFPLTATASKDKLTLSGSGMPGATYVVLGSTNLLTGWAPVSTNVVGANGVVSFTDTNTGKFKARFYRLQLQP